MRIVAALAVLVKHLLPEPGRRTPAHTGTRPVTGRLAGAAHRSGIGPHSAAIQP